MYSEAGLEQEKEEKGNGNFYVIVFLSDQFISGHEPVLRLESFKSYFFSCESIYYQSQTIAWVNQENL